MPVGVVGLASERSLLTTTSVAVPCRGIEGESVRRLRGVLGVRSFVRSFVERDEKRKTKLVRGGGKRGGKSRTELR